MVNHQLRQFFFIVLNRIQHSNFDGEDVKTITGVSIAHPFGIVAYRGLHFSSTVYNGLHFLNITFLVLINMV